MHLRLDMLMQRLGGISRKSLVYYLLKKIGACYGKAGMKLALRTIFFQNILSQEYLEKISEFYYIVVLVQPPSLSICLSENCTSQL